VSSPEKGSEAHRQVLGAAGRGERDEGGLNWGKEGLGEGAHRNGVDGGGARMNSGAEKGSAVAGDGVRHAGDEDMRFGSGGGGMASVERERGRGEKKIGRRRAAVPF
jgi:hypothetical protein